MAGDRGGSSREVCPSRFAVRPREGARSAGAGLSVPVLLQACRRRPCAGPKAARSPALRVLQRVQGGRESTWQLRPCKGHIRRLRGGGATRRLQAAAPAVRRLAAEMQWGLTKEMGHRRAGLCVAGPDLPWRFSPTNAHSLKPERQLATASDGRGQCPAGIMRRAAELEELAPLIHQDPPPAAARRGRRVAMSPCAAA